MSAAKPKEVIEIDASQLVALRRRVEAGTLEPEDFATIDAVLESYAYVTQLIDQKSTTLDRLRKLLFGASSEKTADVLGRAPQVAGEAFDKVAAMLGLPYPGGPAVSRMAESGNPRAYRFPRSYLKEDGRLSFSFSGLKTAVRYAIAGPGKPLPQHALPEQQVRDLCASFQAAVVDVLVDKCVAALRSTKLPRLCVGGGVAANAAFRAALSAAVAQAGCELFIAPPSLCTDNAVMGAIAWEKHRAGQFETLAADVTPGLMRS